MSLLSAAYDRCAILPHFFAKHEIGELSNSQLYLTDWNIIDLVIWVVVGEAFRVILI